LRGTCTREFKEEAVRLEVKHAFIVGHRRLWPVSVQCRLLRVSTPACTSKISPMPGAQTQKPPGGG
jgi:hypothetical protein